MHKSDCSLPWINQEHRTTIGNIDSKINIAITGDDRIDPGALGRRSDRHDSHGIAVNLFSQPSLTRNKLPSQGLVIRVEPLQRSLAIGSDIETGDSQSKAVQHKFQRRKGRKTLYWKVSQHRS
jgi:hypothetical protein